MAGILGGQENGRPRFCLPIVIVVCPFCKWVCVNLANVLIFLAYNDHEYSNRSEQHSCKEN